MRAMSTAVKSIQYNSTIYDIDKYILQHREYDKLGKQKWFYQPAYRHTSAEVGGHQVFKEK